MGIHRGLNSVLALTLIALLAGCSKPKPRPSAPITPRPVSRSVVPLAHVGFAIQAGAFAKVENAARLAGQLQAQGMDATYQPTAAGLFRVRFGDFRSREAARQKAESLRISGLIEAFWIVSPEEQPAARMALSDLPALRRSLVETARSFLGVPYLWGGSTEQGFDCSGLAMAVYQLNGLILPRSSQGQADAGRVVATTDFQAGDLVFFSMSGNGRISHVGVYVGDGTFIHAPSKGGRVRVESLESNGFRGRLVGGRSYL